MEEGIINFYSEVRVKTSDTWGWKSGSMYTEVSRFWTHGDASYPDLGQMG